MSKRDDTYFAVLPPDEIGDAIIAKVMDYYGNFTVQQLLDKQSTAYIYYYGYTRDGWHGGTGVARGGDAGELAVMRVNDARALAQALFAMTVAPQIEWRPTPARYSYDALRATKTAKNALNHYWQNGGFLSAAAHATEQAIVLSEGFILPDFDPFAGSVVFRNEDGSVAQRTGDFRIRNPSSQHVIRDPTKQTWSQCDWKIVRTWENRYDLAVRWPASAKAILDAPERLTVREAETYYVLTPTDWKTDDVEVLRLYVEPSAILPGGREVWCLADGTVLGTPDDGYETPDGSEPPLAYGDLQHDEVPLYRIAPGPAFDTPFGYTPYFEILGIQEAADSIHTSLTTNLTTFGTQYIAVEDGSDTQMMELEGPMSILRYNKGSAPPAGVSLAVIPQGAFDYASMLSAAETRMMGLNSAALGESPGDRASGSLAALLSAQAIQRSFPLQQSFRDALKKSGSFLLRVIDSEASAPLRLSLVSPDEGRSGEFEVKAGDFRDVSKEVYVDIGNPLTQSPEGRLELAKLLVQMKPEDMNFEVISQIIETGKIEPAIDAGSDEMTNIVEENEMMSRGERPLVLIGDNHAIHGKQHGIPVSSQAARRKPEVLQSYDAHMLTHYAYAYAIPLNPPGPTEFDNVKMDPMFMTRMAALTQGIILPPPMAPMPMPGEGAPPDDGPTSTPVPAAGGPPTRTNSPAGGQATKGGTEMPEMPTNPATGAKWNPTTGGGMPSA